MKSASSLRALLNETVEGWVRTDVEKLAQIRAILVEENINQKYPIQRAAGIIYTLQKRIESLEFQQLETSWTNRMVPPPFTEATTTRDHLYNGDSFISINSRLNPFLNFSTRFFMNDSTIGNMCRSTMDIGSRGNHRLVTSGSSLSTIIKLK